MKRLSKWADELTNFKKILVALGLIGGILITSGTFIDTRYAHSTEVVEIHEVMSGFNDRLDDMQQFQQAMSKNFEMTAIRDRMWKLEDRYDCEHVVCREKMPQSTWEEYRNICEKLNHMEVN